jgi:hypothetical protein
MRIINVINVRNSLPLAAAGGCPKARSVRIGCPLFDVAKGVTTRGLWRLDRAEFGKPLGRKEL